MKIIFTFCLMYVWCHLYPLTEYIYTTLMVNDRSLSPVSYFHLIAWTIGFNKDSILFQIQLRPYSIANDIRVNALLSSQDRCLKKAIFYLPYFHELLITINDAAFDQYIEHPLITDWPVFGGLPRVLNW